MGCQKREKVGRRVAPGCQVQRVPVCVCTCTLFRLLTVYTYNTSSYKGFLML